MAALSAIFSSLSNPNQFLTSIKFNVNSLPIELLILIFTFMMSSSSVSKRASTQFHLASVCRFWRKIIFEDSQFWTTMNFELRGYHDVEYKELVFRKSANSRDLVLFSPSARDKTKNTLPNWTAFCEFLQNQSHRVQTLLLDSLSENHDDGAGQLDKMMKSAPRLKDLTLENLQVLSIAYRDSVSINLKATVPNLQALQIHALDGMLPLEFPPHLKKLNLSGFCEDILERLSGLEDLEYLSMLFDDPFYVYNFSRFRINLPSLTTLKSNGSLQTFHMLSAPLLQHVELATPQDTCAWKPWDLMTVMGEVDLSKFTHLYIGYTLSYCDSPGTVLKKWSNPIDGCIWASAGPSDIPCLSDQPTIFKEIKKSRFTELPSDNSDSNDKPLIHLHTIGSYNLDKTNNIIPCTLFPKLVSLETLVLCLPETSHPITDDPDDDLENYDLDLTRLFCKIAHPDTQLLHLIIRSGGFEASNIEVLSQCFDDEDIWTEFEHPCPLLESITYHAPSPSVIPEASQDKFWKTWIDFIALRRKCRHPLKLLRIIGACPPPPRVAKKLARLSKFTKVVIEDDDGTAFRNVRYKRTIRYSKKIHVSSNYDKCYPRRGF